MAPGHGLTYFTLTHIGKNFENLLVWKQKAQTSDIWTIASPSGLLPRLFKLLLWGQKWLRPRADMFYIDI